MDWTQLLNFAPYVVTIVLLLLSTQFVTKKEFLSNKTKRDSYVSLMEKRIAELETQAKLAAQPLLQMVESLKRIETRLDQVLKSHDDLEKRVLGIEIERRLKNGGQSDGNFPNQNS